MIYHTEVDDVLPGSAWFITQKCVFYYPEIDVVVPGS